MTRVDSSAGRVPVPTDKATTSGRKKMSTSPKSSRIVWIGWASNQYTRPTITASSTTDSTPATVRPRSVKFSLRTAAHARAPAVNCRTMRGSQLHGV